jgi:hypothetical protein
MEQLVSEYLTYLRLRNSMLKMDTSEIILKQCEDKLDELWEKITGVKVIW